MDAGGSGLGQRARRCYGPPERFFDKGRLMAHDEEPLLADPPTQDVAIHVRDYERFTRLLKWGAIVCLIIGFIVLLILGR
jgi:hypothetical protein